MQKLQSLCFKDTEQKIQQLTIKTRIHTQKSLFDINTFLKDKNTTFISLGYNCFPRKFISSKVVGQETHYFDNIGAPMWAINEIVKNKFSLDLYNPTDIENIEIVKNKFVNTNKKYYLRFIHDLPTLESLYDKKIFNGFVEKYNRRSKRFLSILDEASNNNRQINFIRIEETKERIKYDAYDDNYKTSELDNIKEFKNIIESLWSKLNFKIIFLSYSTQTTIMDENIIVLHCEKQLLNYDTCDIDIYDIFLKNIDLFR